MPRNTHTKPHYTELDLMLLRAGVRNTKDHPYWNYRQPKTVQNLQNFVIRLCGKAANLLHNLAKKIDFEVNEAAKA